MKVIIDSKKPTSIVGDDGRILWKSCEPFGGDVISTGFRLSTDDEYFYARGQDPDYGLPVGAGKATGGGRLKDVDGILGD